MKRPISIFLAAAIALPTILTTVSGCAKAAAENIMTNGELLDLINYTFGFNDFEETTPYYPSVPANDSFFEDVQIAKEYLVLDDLVTDVKTNDIVTREFFAMAVSGAINDDRTSDITISDINKITYVDDVLTVLNYGLMELSDNGSFEPEKQMSPEECLMLVEEAKQVWLTCTVDEPSYDVSVKEDVIDLAGINDYYFDEDSGNVKFDSDTYSPVKEKLEDNHFSYSHDSGIIHVDSVDEFGIEPGSIMTVPTGDIFHPYYPVRVVSITEESDGTYRIETEIADFEDYMASAEFEQSIDVDVSNAVVYDMNGNIAAPIDSPVVSNTSAYVSNMSNNGISAKTDVRYKGGYVVDTPLGKFTVETKSDNLKIFADINLHPTTSTAYEGEKSEEGKKETKEGSFFTIGYEMKNLHFDTSGSLLKGNYKMVSYCDRVIKLGYKKTYEFKDKKGNDVDKNFQICKVKIPTGVLDLCVDVIVALKISVGGEVTITVTTLDKALGVEQRNYKNFNIINENGKTSFGAHAEVKVEVTFPITVQLSMFAEILTGGVEASGGAGVKISSDSTELENDVLICNDIVLYPILKIKPFIKVEIKKLIKLKFEKSWNFIISDENNMYIKIPLHFESLKDDIVPRLVSKCTKDERLKKEKDEKTAAAGVTVGENLELSVSQKLFLDIGEEADISVTQVPSGYDYNDIKVISFDKDIIEFDKSTTRFKCGYKEKQEIIGLNGYNIKIKGIAAGKTSLKFLSIDGQHSVTLDIYVGNKNDLLDRTIKLNTYGMTLSPVVCSQLMIDRIPVDLTEDDITWTSEDPSIAKVDQYGLVTGVSEGYTTITAMTPDKTSIAHVAITVSNVGVLTWRFIPDTVIEYQI